MKPVKCIECETGVDGCDILSDSERTCCYCIWLGGAADKCDKKEYQSEYLP